MGRIFPHNDNKGLGMHIFEQVNYLRIAFIISGLTISFLMAIGQLVIDRRSTKNFLFLLLFIEFASFNIHFLYFNVEIVSRLSFLPYSFIPAGYLFGPLLYMLYKFSFEKDFKLKKSEVRHLIPLLLIFVYLLIRMTLRYFVQDTEGMSGILSLFMTLNPERGSNVLNTFYIILIWSKTISKLDIKQAFRKKERYVLVYLSLLISTTVGISIHWLFLVTNNIALLDIMLLSLNLTLMFLFLINFKYPDYYQTLRDIAEKEEKKRSYISSLNIDKISSELNYAMMEKEYFTNEDLSLPILAEKLNITSHQLSEFINERFNMNFKAFINKFRVEKAKELLRENSDQVISIAYDVGFKSKSAFNNSFMKYTGTTPTKFRNNNS